MLTLINADLFSSPAQVLVNPVNTVGVMGKGLAKEFKARYPAMFREYRKLCKRGDFGVGSLWLYKAPERWVLNFPTKEGWRTRSTMDIIELGLQKFVVTYATLGIHTIAFPALGCGAGELDFETQVHPLMAHYLEPLSLDAYLYLLSHEKK